MNSIIYETSHQSRFDARYWMLGAGALGRPRGIVRGWRREEGSGWGTHVYLWQIHFAIWQNQYNIVKLKFFFNLKKIKKKRGVQVLCPFCHVKRQSSRNKEASSHQTPNLLKHWSWNSQFLELWKINFCCSWATQSMAFCYNTLNRLRYISRLAFSIIMCHYTATNNSYAINYFFKMQIGKTRKLS